MDPNPPQETVPKRRVLIVDNHPLVRRGLTALIDQEPDLTVCAAVAGHGAALQAIADLSPDLVIVDQVLEDGNGLGLIKDIRLSRKNIPVVMYTMHEAPAHARRAMKAGASGYVTKGETSESLLLGIRRVLDGEKYVSEKIMGALESK